MSKKYEILKMHESAPTDISKLKTDVKTATDKANEAKTKAEQAFQAGSETKQKLVDKLTSVDIEASTTETFEALIGKIEASGKKWSSGTGKTSSRDFFYSTQYFYYDLNVSNLSFIPNTIILSASSSLGATASLYNNDYLKIMMAGRTTTPSVNLGIGSHINLDNGNIRIPFSIGASNDGIATVKWIAYE